MSINCLHITSPQTLSSVTKTTPRHIPYTFQTPHRYSEAHGREGTSWPKWIKSNFYQFISHYTPHHPIPPQTIYKVTQTTSDTSQTSSRNPTDTRKAGTQWPIRVIGRRVNSQLKQYSLFFHWSFISWSGMIILQAVLRITQTPSWYLSDTFQTPSNLLMLALWRASVERQ